MVGLSPRPSRSVLGSSGAASENGLRGNPEGHGWPSARTPAARLRWHCAPARWEEDRTGRRSGDKIRGQLLPDPPRLRASLRALHRLLLPPERRKVAPKATEGGDHTRRWSAAATSQRLVPLPALAAEDGGGAGAGPGMTVLRALRWLLLPPERGKVAPKATEGGGHSRRWSRPPPPPAKGWSPSLALAGEDGGAGAGPGMTVLRALHRLLLPPERGKVAPKATERGRPFAPVVAAAPSASRRLVPLPALAGEDGGGTGTSSQPLKPRLRRSSSRRSGAEWASAMASS
jgi:hypothetical protein